MDSHVLEYYKESSSGGLTPGTYHKVIALHDEPNLGWKEAKMLMPNLFKGWFELSRLKIADRIEFTRDFWLSKLPYHPQMGAFIIDFFSKLDDIGLFLTKKTMDDPFEAHLIYSLKEDQGFYQGLLPISEDELVTMAQDFPHIIFPKDYLSFLEIHNGFAKLNDTGIVPGWRVKDLYKNLSYHLTEIDPVVTAEGLLDPEKLIPFYESFGTHCYQCFWDDWYPDHEMGNVYYSEMARTISDTKAKTLGSDTMAFPTFLDWLMFYLEQVT